MGSIWIKICGVTTPEDARHVIASGADAIGLNFVPSSPRRIDRATARTIVSGSPAQASARGLEWIGVFAGAPPQEIVDTAREVGLTRVQLHGDEPADMVLELQRRGIDAYLALRIKEARDLSSAHALPGDRLLVDAKVEGVLGGTGRSFDPALVVDLARSRPLVLAGGIHPGNVHRLIAMVRPFGVDTASGVESGPGKKDAKLVRAFVDAARAVAIGEEQGSEIGS